MTPHAIGAVRIGIEDAEICDEMLFVVRRERWIGRREVGEIKIESPLVYKPK